MDDMNYDVNVGMVQLLPSSSQPRDLDYPVLHLDEPGLNLSFDLFEENSSYLFAYIKHCNRDWTPSNLSDIQFSDIYNEHNINNYSYSANTTIPYVHYQIELPTPTKSGNYVVVVYKDGNKSDAVFSRRFLVYDNKAKIEYTTHASNNISSRMKNQQIEFEVSYKGIEQANPLREFHVVLLQNHNWNTKISGLQPTLIRQDEQYLEYHHFNQENNFSGLNEFRFFDLRMVDYRGMNISHIEKGPTHIDAYIGMDKSREHQAYAQLIDDLNGDFYLKNNDPSDNELQSEYVNVHFELLTNQISNPIYVTGRFNNWQLDTKNKMIFDQQSMSYKTNILLKQGYYDYFYYVDSPESDFYMLEGSHFQTENNYEILFYYRNPFYNYDELIGYKAFNTGS